MARTDYQDDPDAPRPTSIVPSATVAVRDDAGRILLIHKNDNGYWALPGGGMDLGESIRETAVREAREETALDVELGGLVGVFTHPRHVMEYDDGEVRQEFAVCFHARVEAGTAEGDGDEAGAARWVEPEDVAGLPVLASMRQQIDAALRGDVEPEID
jgi:ADP-ribose pyrophosphatase YjhB (NUDIX family)